MAAALVAQSVGHFSGWGEVVIFAACTAARIGEVSGVRYADIDCRAWTWTVQRQTTLGLGGLIDKGIKGKRARTVPLIAEIQPLVEPRLKLAESDPMARLFTGPRGGRVSTAVIRDATHWDEVITRLLLGSDMSIFAVTICATRALTWMADAGVPVYVLRKIAGHGSLVTTQRYLHPKSSVHRGG